MQVVNARSFQTAKKALEALHTQTSSNPYAAQYWELIPDKELFQLVSESKRADIRSRQDLDKRLRLIQVALRPQVEDYFKSQSLACAHSIAGVCTPAEGEAVMRRVLAMFALNKPAIFYLEQMGVNVQQVTDAHEQLRDLSDRQGELALNASSAFTSIKSALAPILTGEVSLDQLLTPADSCGTYGIELATRDAAIELSGKLRATTAQVEPAASHRAGGSETRERLGQILPSDQTADADWKVSFSNLLEELSDFFKQTD